MLPVKKVQFQQKDQERTTFLPKLIGRRHDISSLLRHVTYLIDFDVESNFSELRNFDDNFNPDNGLPASKFKLKDSKPNVWFFKVKAVHAVRPIRELHVYNPYFVAPDQPAAARPNPHVLVIENLTSKSTNQDLIQAICDSWRLLLDTKTNGMIISLNEERKTEVPSKLAPSFL